MPNQNDEEDFLQRLKAAQIAPDSPAEAIPGVPMPPSRPCPDCGQRCQIKKVIKAGSNRGRRFFACEPCGGFWWADTGTCTECGRPLVELCVKKDGPNQGRRFWACWKRCPDQFAWAEER